MYRYYMTICVVIVIISCNRNCAKEKDIDAIKNTRLEEIADEIGMEFPKKSIIIKYREPKRIIDPVWVAKVKIPNSSVEGFRELVMKKPSEKAKYTNALAESTSWWNPKKIIIEKQYLVDSNTFVNIILSEEGEDFAAYIECAVF